MQAKYIARAISDNPADSDKKRLIAIETGLNLYRQSNPIIGSGLGSYKAFQIEERGHFLDIMDFTGLWLLVETGAAGLISFLGFFLSCLYYIYRQAFQKSHELDSYFYQAIFSFMIVFAGLSLLHELMYTRLLWFLVGLSVAKTAIREIKVK